jgi:hypothetical protein
VLIGAVVAMTVLIGTAVLATHGLAALPGSNFEIDDDANLKLDHAAPSVDWGSLANPLDMSGPELRRTDAPTGQNDDSYKGGVKEDTECPGEVTGSIPNNKSDLLTFHLYEEPGSPGFVNIAWSRVSDPSGTTLMDFEFNQSSTPCATGPNVERTEGDLLIEYAIDQGGARAEISGRFWTGTAWGPVIDLDDGTGCDGGPCAVGTINQTAIPAAESDGLGDKDARTFGEAQIDLDLIFDENECTSFGSAMLKSRSSDAFTSQLKDFIRPIPIDLQNCGNVIIRKQTDPDGATELFGFTKDFDTDPTSDATFTLADDGVKDYDDTVLFGTGYTVTEDDIPTGWDFVSVDCSASTGVTPVIDGPLVTFDIDADTDVLDCTYTNRARGTIIVEKITDDGDGEFDFTSNSLTPASFTLTTTEAGDAGKDSETFSDLAPGTYDVAENVPAGWNLVSATCDDGSVPASIGLSGGETVTCTFHNARELGAIEITKTRKYASAGPEVEDKYAAPHPDVTFTITGGDLPAGGTTVVTDADGIACLDGLLLSSFVGDYTVTETVPEGYEADGDVAKTVSVTAEAACDDGNEATVSFSNTPLTDVEITVTSQDPGATLSTIECEDANGDPVGTAVSIPEDPADFTVEDLPDGTYTCTIVIDP